MVFFLLLWTYSHNLEPWEFSTTTSRSTRGDHIKVEQKWSCKAGNKLLNECHGRLTLLLDRDFPLDNQFNPILIVYLQLSQHWTKIPPVTTFENPDLIIQVHLVTIFYAPLSFYYYTIIILVYSYILTYLSVPHPAEFGGLNVNTCIFFIEP